jgi:hypothetical protein
MKQPAPYICDMCRQKKGETNHWWLYVPSEESFILDKWQDDMADAPGTEHLCSQGCVVKRLSQRMQELLDSNVECSGAQGNGIAPPGTPLEKW